MAPDGKLMNDFTGRVRPDEQGPPKGFLRTITGVPPLLFAPLLTAAWPVLIAHITFISQPPLLLFTVAMDTAQYQLDMNYMAKRSGESAERFGKGGAPLDRDSARATKPWSQVLM